MACHIQFLYHSEMTMINIVDRLCPLDLIRFGLTCKSAHHLSKKCRTAITTKKIQFYMDYPNITSVDLSLIDGSHNAEVTFPPSTRDITAYAIRFAPGSLPRMATDLIVESLADFDFPQLERLNIDYFDLKSAQQMPALRELLVGDLCFIPTDVFPPNLTKLSIDSTPGWLATCESAKFMPRSLTELGITFSQPSHTNGWMMRDLPVGLRKLRITSDSYVIQKDDVINPNLKELGFWVPVLTKTSCTNMHKFPRDLEYLDFTLDHSYHITRALAANTMAIELLKLPKRLTTLIMNASVFENSMLFALPKTITRLEIESPPSEFPITVKFLPQNLTSLRFSSVYDGCLIKSSDIPRLPRTLTYLSGISISYDGGLLDKRVADFGHLIGLEMLKYNCDDSIEVLLPDNLLRLYTNYLPKQLPRHLEYISVTQSLGPQEIKRLPEGLQTITAEGFNCPEGVKFPPRILAIHSRYISKVHWSCFPLTAEECSMNFSSDHDGIMYKRVETIDKIEWVMREPGNVMNVSSEEDD